MAVQFKAEDGKILATIAFSNSFSEIVAVFKSYHSIYSNSSKSWIISPGSFHSICKDLEDIEPIHIVNQEDIDSILAPKSSVIYERIPFEKSELKLPPIEGKHPYENYQLEDIQLCVNRNRWALFNEQGLGKSYEIISALDILRSRNKINKVLFITSASGVYNIKKEFQKFSFFDPDRISIGGVNNREPFSDSSDVVICNYRSFLLVSDHYYKLKNGKKATAYRKSCIPIESWLSGTGALVLDESHNIANPQARQTKAIMMIKDFFHYRYLMTGTPYDKEEKIYSQLKFLDGAFVKNLEYYDWLREYADIGNRFSDYAINYFKTEKKKELSSIVASTCSRRFADDCLNLPEHYLKKIFISFEPKHQALYQDIITQKIKAIRAAHQDSLYSKDVVNAFPYLILGVDNPRILEKHEDSKLVSEALIKKAKAFNFAKDHSKVEPLLDILDKHKGSKIVIWTSHPSVGFEIQKLLEKENPLIINGECPIPKQFKSLDEYKSSIVDEFENNPDRRILIAGIQVFNSSVTLIASNVQIVVDSSFSFTEYSQALKRIHRIGQAKTVYTYILLIDGSLDIVRYKNLEDKDFVNKKFLTKDYLTLDSARDMFQSVY